MKIVLSYIHFPMAIGKYFEAALRRRDDTELFTVGPYSGQWIPWNGGMNLPQKYAKMPDLPFPISSFNLPVVPISLVEHKLPWKPDLWLHVDASWSLRGKPKDGKNVFVATDPHVLNYNPQRQIADAFYCMQTPYMHNGDKYLGYAYDPIWHSPEEQPQEFDACLLGLHYRERTQLIESLRAAGMKVHYDLGPSFDEARAIYCKAPMALNHSSEQDLCARVFEYLAMGRLCITNDVPDLGRFFEDGKHLIAFKSMPEAVERALYYHEKSDEAKEIAEEGHKAVQPHTWDARVEEILGSELC